MSEFEDLANHATARSKSRPSRPSCLLRANQMPSICCFLIALQVDPEIDTAASPIPRTRRFFHHLFAGRRDTGNAIKKSGLWCASVDAGDKMKNRISGSRL